MIKRLTLSAIGIFIFILSGCTSVTGTDKEINNIFYEEERNLTETRSVPGTEETLEEKTSVSETTEYSVREYERLEVHFIDVGEGDSTLIINGDEAMLIDAGKPDKGTAIRLYMKKQGVNKLKYLLLTHPDSDHIGGAASVISNVDIDTLLMSKFVKTNDVYENLLNEIDYRSLEWFEPELGTEYSLEDAFFRVVAPNREYSTPNDSSICIVLYHGDNSFIFTGDAEGDSEHDMVASGMDISADVYHVGHHGSYTSTDEKFLDCISPRYAVISCGNENQYGHPHIETLEKLKERSIELFRTDMQGTIIAFSDGMELVFNQVPTDNWNPGYLINSQEENYETGN